MDVRVFIMLVIPVFVYATTKTRMTCEDFRLKLRCSIGKTIKVTNVMYGREQTDICHDDLADAMTTKCNFPDSTTKVAQECDGKRICNIRAKNDFFGTDPCPETSKYLVVEFECLASASDS